MTDKADDAFVIALGQVTDDHRNAVHEIVKTHAVNWWHHLPDVWIAIGHTHKYWGDLIKPVLALSDARVLVIKLPEDQSARMFAYRGRFPEAAQDWLWESYYGRERPGKVAKKPALPAAT